LSEVPRSLEQVYLRVVSESGAPQPVEAK